MSKVKARGLRVLLAVAAAVLLVLGFCLWTPVTKTRAADGQIMTANDLMLAIYNVQEAVRLRWEQTLLLTSIRMEELQAESRADICIFRPERRGRTALRSI